MMNQNNAVNYRAPQSPENVRHFPSSTPSMEAPKPMPEAKYKNNTETDKIICNTAVNIFWAVAVVILSMLNIVARDLMGSSLIVNIVLTVGAFWKKSAKMANFVTDLNMGLVTLSIIAFICKAIF